MKQNDLNRFKTSVNYMLKLDKNLNNFIQKNFDTFKKVFLKNGFDLRKLGDYSYKSYFIVNNQINLDLCLLKYFPNSTYKITLMVDEALKIVSSFKNVSVNKNPNYINIKFLHNNVEINFRIICMIKRKKDNQIKYIVNRNGLIQEDLCYQITKDFNYANKISNGALISFKKLIVYLIKDEFKYTYNIDFLILRWFYEYFCRTLQEYLDSRFNKLNKEINIKNFMQLKNLRQWFKQNINFYQLYSYVLLKLKSTNTYYFAGFNFESEEIFEGISRYSLNSNSNFSLPIDYFSNFLIVDLNDYNQKSKLHSNFSNENGYSKIIYDRQINLEYRYLVSPKIVTGIANYSMYKKWFTNKSQELYAELDSNIKAEIKSTKQREGMEALNQIAHNWLSIYNQKLKYLAPYFDNKYPLMKQNNSEQLVKLIINSINVIDKNNWIIKNDN